MMPTRRTEMVLFESGNVSLLVDSVVGGSSAKAGMDQIWTLPK
jgi:hypothetical protein